MAGGNLARKQIYIPATKPELEISLRVAAYCRVSTDSDDQRNSFAAQNTHYSEMILSHDRWELVDIYADEGITGTSARKRPDFQRMLTDCRRGKIDKILVKSISRFARNTTDCLETIRELKALGISIYFEEHNIDTKNIASEMLTAVLASCAQAESESISQNTRWGIQKKMRDGTYVAPSVPFGFRWEAGGLVIEEAEAKYVRYAVSAYLAGKNASELAKEFREKSAEDSVLAKRKWSFQTVVEMLKNEKYAGDALCQKTCMTKTLPRRCVRNHGEQDQYYITDAHPAIIDRESYEAVQSLLQRRSEKHVRHTTKTTPLGGKFICGCCGSGFRRKQAGKEYAFACRKHAQDKNACTMPQIPEGEVYRAFGRLYDHLKHDGASILPGMLRNLKMIRDRRMLWSSGIVELNREISDITNQSHQLAVLNKQGVIDPDIFISKTNQLAEQLRKAKRSKEILLKTGDDDLIEKTQMLVEVLEDGPAYLDAFDEKLFCELIDKIIVQSNTEIRFRLMNGLELTETLERRMR